MPQFLPIEDNDPMVFRLILGDQLNSNHSWFKKTEDEVLYGMFEMKQETDYVAHHIQKVLSFFMSMRNFASELKKQGHRLVYYRIDEYKNQQYLIENLRQVCSQYSIAKIEYMLPDEYRMDEILKSVESELGVRTEAVDSEHFYCDRGEVKRFFGKKKYLMESFYRYMRKKHCILVEGDSPKGGKWNYDQSNRKSLPNDVELPMEKIFSNKINGLDTVLDKMGIETIGRVEGNGLNWPISRSQSREALEHFVSQLLPFFGTYQDAMTVHSPFLFHSKLSFALNSKMLSPAEVIEAVCSTYKDSGSDADISQVEGFVRQVIGWREYMRGIYWAEMPGYKKRNFFDHSNPLPGWYWTGKTKMNCLKHAIGQSLDHAYAHHIQRLMLTGNFALLAGCDPNEVDQWYLGIYIDAVEWVEITNTRGMSQYADGGLLATKPYISSANYIHKMSDYCRSCHYKHQVKTGEKSCPFNSLYWHFLEKNKDQLADNPRMGMMYNSLKRMKADKRKELMEQAAKYLDNIEQL